MSKSKIKPIQIVPFPDGTVFKTNSIVIQDKIYDKNDTMKKYDHTGKYVITSSSYSSKTTTPASAFNGNKEIFWQTNFKGNSNIFDPVVDAYSSDPYTNSDSGASAYQGGGLDKNTYVTMVGKDDKKTPIKGEWIQIELPKTNPVYIFRYSILTPKPQGGVVSFPKKFLLVGSKDGILWEYIDQRNLVDPPDTTNRDAIVFDVNSTDYYFFYRLIVGEMYSKNNILRINQINLFGMVSETPNRDAFTNMEGNRVQYYDFNNPSTNYANFSISNAQEFMNDNKEIVKIDNNKIFYGILFTTLVTSSILFYSIIKKK
jgi:hypothetical protein